MVRSENSPISEENTLFRRIPAWSEVKILRFLKKIPFSENFCMVRGENSPISEENTLFRRISAWSKVKILRFLKKSPFFGEFPCGKMTLHRKSLLNSCFSQLTANTNNLSYLLCIIPTLPTINIHF